MSIQWEIVATIMSLYVKGNSEKDKTKDSKIDRLRERERDLYLCNIILLAIHSSKGHLLIKSPFCIKENKYWIPLLLIMTTSILFASVHLCMWYMYECNNCNKEITASSDHCKEGIWSSVYVTAFSWKV